MVHKIHSFVSTSVLGFTVYVLSTPKRPTEGKIFVIYFWIWKHKSTSVRAVAGAMDKSLMAAHFAHLYRAVDNFWMNSAHYNAHKATCDSWMTAEILLCRQRTWERGSITAVDAFEWCCLKWFRHQSHRDYVLFKNALEKRILGKTVLSACRERLPAQYHHLYQHCNGTLSQKLKHFKCENHDAQCKQIKARHNIPNMYAFYKTT